MPAAGLATRTPPALPVPFTFALSSDLLSLQLLVDNDSPASDPHPFREIAAVEVEAFKVDYSQASHT